MRVGVRAEMGVIMQRWRCEMRCGDEIGGRCEGDGGDANSRLGVDEQLIASSVDWQLGWMFVS